MRHQRIPNCYGVGMFDVLSDIERYINNPQCSEREKAAISPGTYWIVDRPTGSVLNQVRAGDYYQARCVRCYRHCVDGSRQAYHA